MSIGVMGFYRCLWVFGCLWVLMGGMSVWVLYLNIENISYFLIQEPQKI